MLDVLIAVSSGQLGQFSLPATAPDPAAPPAWAEQMMGAMGQMAAVSSCPAQQAAQRPAEVVVPRIGSRRLHRGLHLQSPVLRLVSVSSEAEATVGTGMGLQLPWWCCVWRIHEGLALPPCALVRA